MTPSETSRYAVWSGGTTTACGHMRSAAVIGIDPAAGDIDLLAEEAGVGEFHETRILREARPVAGTKRAAP